ncbi:MAG: DUF547 domain-containing protein [Pseudomonadota bacterium]
MIDRRRLLALAAGSTLVAAAPAAAAPASRLIDDRWTRFGSGGDPDHGTWGGLLQRHLSRGSKGVALFDYAAAGAARGTLGGYLEAMQAVRPTTLSRPAAMAYWINLYNAVTIDLVLEAWPVDSIKEVRGGLFNTGPWGDEVVRVEGQDLSLDDIEHGILRPVWRDARIHYAVNCASIGCPDLATRPFTAATLEGMMDEGMRTYVAHPRGARVEGGEVTVSTIYDWFSEDFGTNERAVLAHIVAAAPTQKASALQSAGQIDDYAYDWSINAAA